MLLTVLILEVWNKVPVSGMYWGIRLQKGGPTRELKESLMRTGGTFVSVIELSCCTDCRPTLTFYSLAHSISLVNDSDLSGLLL